MIDETYRWLTGEPQSSEDALAGIQSLIDSGNWSFEGSVGRSMNDAIESGYAVLGPTPARDYWGNRIPSRFEVKPGTKGSIEYGHEHGSTEAGHDETDSESCVKCVALRAES